MNGTEKFKEHQVATRRDAEKGGEHARRQRRQRSNASREAAASNPPTPPPAGKATTARKARIDGLAQITPAATRTPEPDLVAPAANRQSRRLRNPLWVHPDVSDGVRTWPHLYRRLGVVLHQLAAHGRTSVVKGCHDDNRGWLRSPLGGNNGRQYYVWWAHEGTRMTRKMELPEHAIIVRTVRHHDHQHVLAAGTPDDYLTLENADEITEDIAGEPWTNDQRAFVDGTAPVRLLLGRPGCGKTTALWHAIEARANERVLYLTWSTELCRQAAEHFASFAPSDVEVETMNFAGLLGEITATDIQSIPMHTSRERFRKAVAKIGGDVTTWWSQDLNALHAEIYGVMLGNGLFEDKSCTEQDGVWRLNEEAYLRLRGNDKNGIGSRPARAAIKTMRKLTGATLRQIYPEVIGANDAIKALRNNGGELVQGLDNYDRIVVDEAQDLTLAETSVITAVCVRIAAATGKPPKLLIAGDAGQTVRPSAFSWAAVSRLITKTSGKAESFRLDEHVRCPMRIANVIDRASEMYKNIDKALRPEKQYKQTGAEHVEAQLIHVHTENFQESEKLLEALDQAEDVAVIAPYGIPEWVSEKYKDMVLLPEDAKGLEYQSVVLLDVGDELDFLNEMNDSITCSTMEQEGHRTNIDMLRVALSRATETLAIVDMGTQAGEAAHTAELLREAVPYSVDDLAEYLANRDTAPEERVLARTRDAAVLIESAPVRAWQCACQAKLMLGDANRPNGVADRHVRKEARRTLLATAARLLASGDDRLTEDGLQRSEITTRALQTVATDIAAAANGDGQERATPLQLAEVQAVAALERWCKSDEDPGILTLDSWEEMQKHGGRDDDWMHEAIGTITQALRKRIAAGAANREHAHQYTQSNVARWLEATGQKTGVDKRAKQLATLAFDTLIESARERSTSENEKARIYAEHIINNLEHDPQRKAALAELKGQTDNALALYREADADKDVLRILLSTGRWTEAVGLGDEATRRDLEWMIKLRELVDARPPDHQQRMNLADAEQVRKLLAAVETDLPDFATPQND